MPRFKEVFAKRLKLARVDADFTQAKLAATVASCGVACTQSQIASYENAASKSIPSAEKLAAIAKTLEKSADWLCGLDIKGNSEADVHRPNKEDEMKIELKPCPFCGGVVELDDRKDYEERQGYYGKACLSIDCMDCGAQVTAYNHTDGPLPYETMAKMAAEKWNRRA